MAFNPQSAWDTFGPENVEPLIPKIEALALDAFLNRKFPPRETLLSPWLPEKGLAMVFAHVPQHVESGHRLHFNVGDDNLGLDAVELLDRFRRRVKRENLVTLLPTKRHDDFDHRWLVVDDDNLGHRISARRIFHI